MSKRQRVAHFLHRSGALRFVLALRAHVTAPWLSILTYHRFPDFSGYEIGFTNGTGPTPLWRRFDPFSVCRQTVNRDLSAHYLLGIAAIPMLAPKHPWHLTAR